MLDRLENQGFFGEEAKAVNEEAARRLPMPFGKHKGQPLQDVPEDYLSWVLREKAGNKPLRESVKTELRLRKQETEKQ